MEPVAFAILIACVALGIGCWLGWSICNARWSDAARLNVPVLFRGDEYHVYRDSDFAEPCDPPDVLSSE